MRLEMRAGFGHQGHRALESYSDADFAADKGDRKLLTGAIVLLNGMSVSWAAKKQGGVSLSTMEAEFVAAFETAREILGICDAKGGGTCAGCAHVDACGQPGHHSPDPRESLVPESEAYRRAPQVYKGLCSSRLHPTTLHPVGDDARGFTNDGDGPTQASGSAITSKVGRKGYDREEEC